MNYELRTNYFSLIELLIVLAIIGALSALIIPSFDYSEAEAKTTINTNESRTIQKSFLDFYSDVVPTETQLQDFAKYGLTPLLQNADPEDETKTLFDEWDHNRSKGWRGPYLSTESSENVDITKKDGQNSTGSTRIPVVKNSSDDFYRVMIPKEEGTNTTAKANFLCLVDTGINGVLDLTKIEINTDTYELTVTDQGDDEVIRLLPFN